MFSSTLVGARGIYLMETLKIEFFSFLGEEKKVCCRGVEILLSKVFLLINDALELF